MTGADILRGSALAGLGVVVVLAFVWLVGLVVVVRASPKEDLADNLRAYALTRPGMTLRHSPQHAVKTFDDDNPPRNQSG
ncbi:MAG TPA: hypothetical protein VLJ59_10640 [Mycobacteriales bacterium]|nr:hypothetical protein [Mycobacteriales bacterium]